MVKIRPRKTKEGGADIDVIAKLEEARKKVEKEKEDRERESQEINELREMMS